MKNNVRKKQKSARASLYLRDDTRNLELEGQYRRTIFTLFLLESVTVLLYLLDTRRFPEVNE